MKGVAYFMDPEALLEFAAVPANIPARFKQAIYDELWAYWGAHCARGGAGVRAEMAAVAAAIRARQNGWCSIADLREAGYTECGRRMVPEAVVAEVVARIINSECPC